MVIKLTNVSKVIKKAKVLDNVNLELTSGKVYGLKGKNGSGKTMLMRVICGLISATEGTVDDRWQDSWKGYDISGQCRSANRESRIYR